MIDSMTATLTLTLDPRVLEFAEQEAQRRHTTVADLVARQVQVMASNWQESQSGRTPITDALRGTVSLPSVFDERTALIEELSRKHGA